MKHSVVPFALFVLGQGARTKFGAAVDLSRDVAEANSSANSSAGPVAEAQDDWKTYGTKCPWYSITDMKHGKLVVAGWDFDGQLYHQSLEENGDNAWWQFVAIDGTGESGLYHVKDKKHHAMWVAGLGYDGHVYHQYKNLDTMQSQWKLEPQPLKGWYYLTEVARNDQIVAGGGFDGHVYNQKASGQQNGMWKLTCLQKPGVAFHYPVGRWNQVMSANTGTQSFTLSKGWQWSSSKSASTSDTVSISTTFGAEVNYFEMAKASFSVTAGYSHSWSSSVSSMQGRTTTESCTVQVSGDQRALWQWQLGATDEMTEEKLNLLTCEYLVIPWGQQPQCPHGCCKDVDCQQCKECFSKQPE